MNFAKLARWAQNVGAQWAFQCHAANPNMARIKGLRLRPVPDCEGGGWSTDADTARKLILLPRLLMLAEASDRLDRALANKEGNEADLVAAVAFHRDALEALRKDFVETSDDDATAKQTGDFVAMPREPSDEIIKAADDAMRNRIMTGPLRLDTLRGGYRAMIAVVEQGKGR